MSQVSASRNLKRYASSSDTEEAPQARTSVQNASVRRCPPLRRSDSQGLDINATSAVIEHLPHTREVPVPSELQCHPKEEDCVGSTDEESQDEDAVWEHRAKAYRHNMLFKRPRDPAPKIKRSGPLLIKTASELALIESDSEDDGASPSTNIYGAGKTNLGKYQRVMGPRATRAAVPKGTQVSAGIGANGASTSPINTVATTIQDTCATPETTITTTTFIPGPVRTRKAPSIAGLERPQRQNNRTRQNAINAIAGHCSTVGPSTSAAYTLSGTSPLLSTPSQILRRSRRIAAKQHYQTLTSGP